MQNIILKFDAHLFKKFKQIPGSQKHTNFVTFSPHCLHSTITFFLGFFPKFFSYLNRLYFSQFVFKTSLSLIIYSLRVPYFKMRTSFLLFRSNRTTHVSVTSLLSSFKYGHKYSRTLLYVITAYQVTSISSHDLIFFQFIFHSCINKFLL